MGYNQHNAGMHLVPHQIKKSETTSVGKYADMIQTGSCMQDEKIVKDIELCNFVLLSQRRGSRKKCLCGGCLDYKDNLPVKFHRNNEMQTTYLSGKQCRDCGRKLFIRSDILKKVKEVNG